LAIKCNNPERLIEILKVKFNIKAENPTSGKYVLRIDDVICNVFLTGTVNFQGRVNEEVLGKIKHEIDHLNES
jgi:ribonuclease HIII